MARADYERFMGELENVVGQMGAINVAGIEQGVIDELTELQLLAVRLKQKARFIGMRTIADQDDDEGNLPPCGAP